MYPSTLSRSCASTLRNTSRVKCVARPIRRSHVIPSVGCSLCIAKIVARPDPWLRFDPGSMLRRERIDEQRESKEFETNEATDKCTHCCASDRKDGRGLDRSKWYIPIYLVCTTLCLFRGFALWKCND